MAVCLAWCVPIGVVRWWWFRSLSGSYSFQDGILTFRKKHQSGQIPIAEIDLTLQSMDFFRQGVFRARRQIMVIRQGQAEIRLCDYGPNPFPGLVRAMATVRVRALKSGGSLSGQGWQADAQGLKLPDGKWPWTSIYPPISLTDKILIYTYGQAKPLLEVKKSSLNAVFLEGLAQELASESRGLGKYWFRQRTQRLNERLAHLIAGGFLSGLIALIGRGYWITPILAWTVFFLFVLVFIHTATQRLIVYDTGFVIRSWLRRREIHLNEVNGLNLRRVHFTVLGNVVGTINRLAVSSSQQRPVHMSLRLPTVQTNFDQFLQKIINQVEKTLSETLETSGQVYWTEGIAIHVTGLSGLHGKTITPFDELTFSVQAGRLTLLHKPSDTKKKVLSTAPNFFPAYQLIQHLADSNADRLANKDSVLNIELSFEPAWH
ncbi:MAG: hypothetical protein KDC71_14055 [Acidobacteria bacterium]|nr:hypothetical protein [Acidobacteriota bacterium]